VLHLGLSRLVIVSGVSTRAPAGHSGLKHTAIACARPLEFLALEAVCSGAEVVGATKSFATMSNALPLDVLDTLASFLKAEDLSALQGSSRLWRDQIKSERVWRAAYLRRWQVRKAVPRPGQAAERRAPALALQSLARLSMRTQNIC
jgi:hypothetical protein